MQADAEYTHDARPFKAAGVKQTRKGRPSSFNSQDVDFDVCYALTGDARRNSRTLRQLRVFAAMGLRVCVLAYGPPEAVGGALPGGAALRLLPRPAGGGPRFFWRNHRAMRRAARETSARVYHASDLFVLPALADAARQQGARLAYDARELYPHVFGTVGKPWASFFWRRLEGRYARRADAVFTVNVSIADWMARAYGIAPPTVLFNVPDALEVAPSDTLRRLTGLAPHVPLVLYQGALFPHRGLPVLVEAMGQIPHAALVLMGEGPLRPALEKQIAARGMAARAFVLDAVPPDVLLGVTAGADVGVLPLDDVCLSYHYALPNKLFEYLRAGLPVAATDLPEIRRVVAGAGVGLLSPPGDAHALARNLETLLADAPLRAAMAARIPRVFETYAPSGASEGLSTAYRRLLHLPASP